MPAVRRSKRNVGKMTSYIDCSPMSMFPDGPPATPLERTFQALNLEAFPLLSYALVDDILVHALFATKLRAQGYRAIQPRMVGGGPRLSDKEALGVWDIINSNVEKDHPTRVECEAAAVEIQRHLHLYLLEEHIPIIRQCVV
jgi:hypothetical protein